MSNPAINVAIMAAAHQADQSRKAVLEPLRAAAATAPARAVPLDLSVKGSGEALRSLVKRGFVREVGGSRYWIDEERIAAAKQEARRWALVTIAGLTAVLASLLAYLLTR